MVSLPEAYPRAAGLSLSPEDQQVATSIRKKQTAALVSAVAAATLLLVIVLLQLVPGMPIAVGIALGVVAVALTGAAIGCLVSRIRDSNRLTKALSNSIDLIKLRSLEETRPSLQYRRTKRPSHKTRKTPKPKPTELKIETISPPKDEPLIRVVSETPPATPAIEDSEPSSETDFSMTGSSSDEEEEIPEQLFTKKSIDLFKHVVPNKTNPSVATCNFYKKRQELVKKVVENMCKTGQKIATRMQKGEGIISKEEGAGAFSPIGSKDNVIISILSGFSDLFSSSECGVVWFHNAIHFPKESLQSLVQLSEMFRQAEKTTTDKLLPAFLGINIILSGWILGDPALLAPVVGSVQDLPIPEREKEEVLKLLNEGNVVSALVLATQSRYSEVSAILDSNSSKDEGGGQPIPFEEISPKNLRRHLASADATEEDSEKDLEEFTKKYHVVIASLEKALPNSKLLLAAAITKGAPEIAKAFKELVDCFNGNKPNTPSRIFKLLRIANTATRLQKVLKTYLPSRAIPAMNSLLSKALKGAFNLGLFTLQQQWGLAKSLRISESEFSRLIESEALIKHALPELMK